MGAYTKKWGMLILLLPLIATAEGKEKKLNFLIQFSANYLYAKSKADTISDAVYSQKYQNPVVGAVSLGVGVLKKLYLGLRYEYWYGRRKFTLNNVEQTDSLKYQTIGPEVGLFHANSRVQALAAFGVFFPLRVAVESQGTGVSLFENKGMPVTLEARGLIAVRIVSPLSFFLEAGYRSADLGKLVAADQSPYIVDNGILDFDLSGPFLGLGLALSF
ncbi:MAG: hypothetical protein HY537_02935 [Deltaproteobacteria bacterium]|nr:hypothetical protein [Deltaproteobacteria bacterium]